MKQLKINQALDEAAKLWDKLNELSSVMDVSEEIKALNAIIASLQQKASS